MSLCSCVGNITLSLLSRIPSWISILSLTFQKIRRHVGQLGRSFGQPVITMWVSSFRTLSFNASLSWLVKGMCLYCAPLDLLSDSILVLELVSRHDEFSHFLSPFVYALCSLVAEVSLQSLRLLGITPVMFGALAILVPRNLQNVVLTNLSRNLTPSWHIPSCLIVAPPKVNIHYVT